MTQTELAMDVLRHVECGAARAYSDIVTAPR